MPPPITVRAWMFSLLFGAISFGQTVTPNPATLTHSFALDGAAATTTLSLAGTGAVKISFATESGGNWLAITPIQGSLPLTAAVTMDPSGLPDGTYLASITAGSAAIPVTILVGDPGPQLPAGGIVNAASYQSEGISPGEIVALFGTSIGPTISYSAQVWDGMVTAKLAGTRVWFDDTPAPIIYAYPNQLAAVVPYNVAGKASVKVQVENRVARTPVFLVPVKAATPALFTADASGKGQVAAQNQDLSTNSPSNPAAPGSVVVLYATGAGLMNPVVPDGTLVPSSPLPAPVLPVGVIIGGKNAEIVYAGAAPQLVAGALQINTRVPAGTPPGAAAVTLTVGDAASPDGCTISVR